VTPRLTALLAVLACLTLLATPCPAAETFGSATAAGSAQAAAPAFAPTSGDAPVALPASVPVISIGTAFPRPPDMSVSPSQLRTPPPERAARREALAQARREALSAAVFAVVPPGPARAAFLLVRPWLERMEDAYLEAVQVTHEETDDLGALRLTVSSAVRVADMIADAQSLAPRQHLRNLPAVRVEVQGEPPLRPQLERLAKALRQDLTDLGATETLPAGTPPPAVPLRLTLRPATPAETNGKGDAVVMELLGFREERLLAATCPESALRSAQAPCVENFRAALAASFPALWRNRFEGPTSLTVQHQNVVSEDRGRQVAHCLGAHLPGAASAKFLHYLSPVAAYRLDYRADPAFLDQDLRLNGVGRLCGDFGVARIEGETVVIVPRSGR